MASDDRAPEVARRLCPCTCWPPSVMPPKDGRGLLADGSHYANCPSENWDDIAAELAARDAEKVAAIERVHHQLTGEMEVLAKGFRAERERLVEALKRIAPSSQRRPRAIARAALAAGRR